MVYTQGHEEGHRLKANKETYLDRALHFLSSCGVLSLLGIHLPWTLFVGCDMQRHSLTMHSLILFHLAQALGCRELAGEVLLGSGPLKGVSDLELVENLVSSTSHAILLGKQINRAVIERF